MTPEEQTRKLHAEWLRHPVTVDVINLLKHRKDNFVRQLQEGILTSSNPPAEEKLRVAGTTLGATIVMLTDTNIFVTELNKIKQ